MFENIHWAWLVGGAAAIFLVGIAFLFARFYRKVDQGKALIINKMKHEPEVTFTGGVVYPIFHRAETMDISVKTIEIDRRGKEGLICMDNIRADIKVTFFVRVNKTKDDVLRVAQAIGCDRASDQETLEALFNAKFSEALKTVGKKLDFEQLYTQREDFKDRLLEVIGRDLNGYILDDAAIDFLEQTPVKSLDPDNILDARGIRKITEITAGANVQTNDLRQKERMEMGRQNLESDEAIYRFDQQRADAAAKKDKEIAMSQARESNEAMRLKLAEEKRTHVERQKVEEEVKLAEEAKIRATQVAEQARLREVGVEQVRVAKAADLEQVDRQREVDLRTIEKDKVLEMQKREIADVVRSRIAVEKTVAEEEENIKDIRVVSDAKRTKEATVITAQAAAEENLIAKVRNAEADEEVARAEARKMATIAEAELDVSDKGARAKIRLAEGIQAEEAAPGLAEVRVKEADAVAIEKQGLAAVKVREAAVVITEREGMVDAQVAQERGMAEARIKEAEAVAIEKRMNAEASGLAAKAEAMANLDEAGREFEEMRMRLDQQLEIAMKSLDARVVMAEKHAEILKEAFDEAKFNIVGGDGAFFDRFVKAVAVGQSIDGVVDNSTVVQNAFGKHLNGEGNLLEELKGMLGGQGLSSETLKNLSVTAVLGQMMLNADDQTKSKLQILLEQAQQLGIDKAGN